jgi:hypothetical protein
MLIGPIGPLYPVSSVYVACDSVYFLFCRGYMVGSVYSRLTVSTPTNVRRLGVVLKSTPPQRRFSKLPRLIERYL